MKPLRITYYHMSDAVHEFWVEHSEEVGMALWLIAILMICAMAWVALDACEAPFR